MKKEYDAIIIGGGSMGLTLGAYLQRAGMETAIFERRWEEGSAIYTSECTAPGFLHNLHANFCEFMDWHPPYHDFKLEELGARTIYPEAQAAIGFSDGRPPIVLYSVENPENFKKTHKSIAQYSKHDADTYVGLRKKIMELQDVIAATYYNPPQDVTGGREAFFPMLGIPADLTTASCRAIVDYLYESPEFKTMMYRILQEFGPELEMEGLGAMILGNFWISLNWRMMVGGTHTLAHALEMACVREGMDFYENCEVVKVLLDNGRASGIQLKDGTQIKARKLVASNADIKATMLDMVGEENLSETWVKRIKNYRVGYSNVLASTALALHEAPDYKSAKYNPDMNKAFYTIVGFDTPEEILQYVRDGVSGRMPEIAGAGTWVNSLWDQNYAPKGKHSLTGWFFAPKASALTIEEWDEVKATYNDKFIKRFKKWAPNMTRDNVIADYFYTPLDQALEMRMMEGDFQNGSYMPNQTGHNRPFPEASQYRTEIEGLYLCGPYMHPGGGVSSGAGYNCFKVVAHDFGLEKFWENHPRGF